MHRGGADAANDLVTIDPGCRKRTEHLLALGRPDDAPSPVVPNAVTLEQSPSRHQRACATRRGKSMPVPGRNGVAKAAERPKRLLEVITVGPHFDSRDT